MGTTTGMICSAGGIKSTMIDSTVAGFATRGLMPFGSSCLVGYIMGFAMKKIIKWALIILGVLAGMIFLAIQWMWQNGYINGKIDWDKLGNNIASYGQRIASQFDFTNLHNVFHYLGIPVTSGFAVGMIAGFVRTK